jgi:hypothetical protein
MGVWYILLALCLAWAAACLVDGIGHNPHAPSVWDRLWKWVKNRRHR